MSAHDDDLLDHIDVWCDDYDTRHPLEARELLRELWDKYAAAEARVVAAETAPSATQWIVTAGANVHSPVGPFGSYGEAEGHYKANQPQGQGWLAQPTIVRLLRPALLDVPDQPNPTET